MRLAGIKWLVLLLGLSLGIMAGPTLSIGAASAESSQGRGLELLSRATKSFEAGAYADAAELIDLAFKAGLTGELAARAILLRGEVNERSGSYAKALQDYSNAIWMDSLPAGDRKKAADGKERVLAAMGMTSTGASTQASAPAAQSGGSSSGVFGFITGVFGGSESAPPPKPAETQQVTQAPPPPPAEVAKPPQKAPAKTAAKPAKVAHAKPAAQVPQASAQPASSLSVSAASGEYLIMFGSANSEASARSTAKAIKAQLSDILVHRDLDVTQRAGGGFVVQAGPYKTKGSAVALCSEMQKRGVQCRVTP